MQCVDHALRSSQSDLFDSIRAAQSIRNKITQLIDSRAALRRGHDNRHIAGNMKLFADSALLSLAFAMRKLVALREHQRIGELCLLQESHHGFVERGGRVADIYQDADVMKLAKDSVTRLLKEDRELADPSHERLRELLKEYLEKGQLM